jgi:hypothetical protein
MKKNRYLCQLTSVSEGVNEERFKMGLEKET